MNVRDAIHTKRAVRQFRPDPVPEAVIREILEAGRRAQSSQNKQPWRFVVVRERATLAELAQCGPGAGHLAGAAFAVALVAETAWAFDIGQAAAYLQLAAWELGVSSCVAWIQDTPRALSLLGAPPDRRLEIMLSFGLAAEAPARPRVGGRRPFDEVVNWERWR